MAIPSSEEMIRPILSIIEKGTDAGKRCNIKEISQELFKELGLSAEDASRKDPVSGKSIYMLGIQTALKEDILKQKRAKSTPTGFEITEIGRVFLHPEDEEDVDTDFELDIDDFDAHIPIDCPRQELPKNKERFLEQYRGTRDSCAVESEEKKAAVSELEQRLEALRAEAARAERLVAVLANVPSENCALWLKPYFTFTPDTQAWMRDRNAGTVLDVFKYRGDGVPDELLDAIDSFRQPQGRRTEEVLNQEGFYPRYYDEPQTLKDPTDLQREVVAQVRRFVCASAFTEEPVEADYRDALGGAAEAYLKFVQPFKKAEEPQPQTEQPEAPQAEVVPEIPQEEKPGYDRAELERVLIGVFSTGSHRQKLMFLKQEGYCRTNYGASAAVLVPVGKHARYDRNRYGDSQFKIEGQKYVVLTDWTSESIRKFRDSYGFSAAKYLTDEVLKKIFAESEEAPAEQETATEEPETATAEHQTATAEPETATVEPEESPVPPEEIAFVAYMRKMLNSDRVEECLNLLRTADAYRREKDPDAVPLLRMDGLHAAFVLDVTVAEKDFRKRLSFSVNVLNNLKARMQEFLPRPETGALREALIPVSADDPKTLETATSILTKDYSGGLFLKYPLHVMEFMEKLASELGVRYEEVKDFDLVKFFHSFGSLSMDGVLYPVGAVPEKTNFTSAKPAEPDLSVPAAVLREEFPNGMNYGSIEALNLFAEEWSARTNLTYIEARNLTTQDLLSRIAVQKGLLWFAKTEEKPETAPEYDLSIPEKLLRWDYKKGLDPENPVQKADFAKRWHAHALKVRVDEIKAMDLPAVLAPVAVMVDGRLYAKGLEPKQPEVPAEEVPPRTETPAQVEEKPEPLDTSKLDLSIPKALLKEYWPEGMSCVHAADRYRFLHDWAEKAGLDYAQLLEIPLTEVLAPVADVKGDLLVLKPDETKGFPVVYNVALGELDMRIPAEIMFREYPDGLSFTSTVAQRAFLLKWQNAAKLDAKILKMNAFTLLGSIVVLKMMRLRLKDQYRALLEGKPEEEKGLSEELCRRILSEKMKAVDPSSPIARKKFAGCYAELGGELSEPVTEELLREALSPFTVETKSGFMLPEKMLPPELLKEIEADIAKLLTQTPVVYYDAVYARFSAKLIVTDVSDGRALAAVLRLEKPEGMVLREEYAAANAQTQSDPAAELKRVFELKAMPMTAEELVKALPGYTAAFLESTMKSSDFLSDNGRWFLPSMIDISEETVASLRGEVDASIEEKKFISRKALLELLKSRFPEVPENNGFLELSDTAFVNALVKRMGAGYSVWGAVIQKAGDAISKPEVFRRFCLHHTTVTLDELHELSQELDGTNGIPFEAVLDIMVREDEQTFVYRETVGFDAAAIDEALDAYGVKTALPLSEVNNYLLLPPMYTPWNRYLLESYLYRGSKRYSLEHIGFSENGVYGLMVAKESGIDDFLGAAAAYIAGTNVPAEAEALKECLKENNCMQYISADFLSKLAARVKAIRAAED